MGISRVIAEHVSSTSFSNIPAPAIDAARRSFCDTLGVALAGAEASGRDIVFKLAQQESGVRESSVWGGGGKLAVTSATLVNSFAAGALDYDSLHPLGLVHPGVCTVPAGCAIAERAHASGEELLAALAIADDLMCRMGLAHQSNRGWYLTALYGGMAAAIVSAKLMRLDSAQIEHALGLAFITASGTQIGMAERSLAKRLQTALAASSGVRAAVLAAEGYSGPAEIFEGPFGFYNMYQSGDANAITQGLGERYENTAIIYKTYPNCGCAHAVLEGLLEIVNSRDIAPGEVLKIETIISPYMHRLVGAPFDPDPDPQVAAQFSIQYAAACAVLLRRFTLSELEDASVRDPTIGELAQRVVVTVDANNSGGVAPAEARIFLRDGTVHSKVVRQLKGSAGIPPDEKDLEQKFFACVAHCRRFTPQAAQALFNHARLVEKLKDMSEFFAGTTLQMQ